jgi:hypothetical protein
MRPRREGDETHLIQMRSQEILHCAHFSYLQHNVIRLPKLCQWKGMQFHVPCMSLSRPILRVLQYLVKIANYEASH